MVRPPLVWCVLALLASSAQADSWPVARRPSREPAPHRYEPRSLAQVPRAFLDDSVATVLYAASNYLVDPDGTVETITHEITRLNGRKGVEKLGEFRGILYTPGHQKLTLNLARIHKARGGVVEVEAHHLHLRDVATDYQVYNPEKQLIISFPGLEVGDTLEVKWTVRGRNPEHEGQFFQRYSFGDTQYPVVVDEVRVRLPRSTPLKFACVNGSITPTLTENAGQRLYHWRTINRPRPPRDEHLPSREELRPTLLLSTFSDWKQVGQWKHRLRKECWKCTAEVRQVVQQVTQGLSSPVEKARALTYWVRRQIRYVSTGERHDYTPHLPARVLANRFGDCKDTSQLLAVMLREVGIPVELATLGSRDDGQVHPDVPSPWGTHAILLATIAGKHHWIDTTASLAAWDFLPVDDCDRLCYLTDDRGTLRLLRTPPSTPEHHRIEQTTEVWIGQDGTSHCQRTVTAHGYSAILQRASYVETPPGERRRKLAAELQDANSRTRLVSLDVNEKALGNYDQPVVIRMEFEIPRHFSGTSEREGSVTDSKVWGRLLAYAVDHQRTAPLVLPGPFESIHTYRFHAPSVFTLDGIPAEKKVQSPWGSFTLKVRSTQAEGAIRQLELTFHTRLEKTRVELSDLESFRRFHEEVYRDYRAWVTLRPVTQLQAASRLELLLGVAPENNLAAATLARIYLLHDRFSDARRVLDRARSYSPEDADLSDLRIRAAETADDEEKIQRELVKQQPENANRVLSLAANLISQGKQEEARSLLAPLLGKAAASQRAQAHYQLARSHYRKDELNLALDHLEKGFKADPAGLDRLRVHVLHGQVLEELKRPAEARTAYRHALKRQPSNQEVLLSLVRLSLSTKDELAALDYLRRYALQAGKDVTGLLLAAETYYQLKRYDEARELALRAREIGFHEKAQRLLGLVALRREKYSQAIIHLERAELDAAVLDGLIRARLALGSLSGLDVLLDRGERLSPLPESSARLCQRARLVLRRRSELQTSIRGTRTPQEGSALDALACAEDLHRQGGPTSQIASLLERAAKQGAAPGLLHAWRGQLALDQGKLRSALAEATQAVRLAPEFDRGHLVLGLVFLEREDPRAIEHLQEAARRSQRQDAPILARLAEAQIQAGRLKEARQTLQQALKLQPKDRNLLEQLQAMEEMSRKRSKRGG